ncbi:hypothetical protein SPHINGOT1_120362 [Sphingomonas sp. T1]|nr:hypothetical protein SPHINGOT1_120362 [Sphingomonas sp. T1]
MTVVILPVAGVVVPGAPLQRADIHREIIQRHGPQTFETRPV